MVNRLTVIACSLLILAVVADQGVTDDELDENDEVEDKVIVKAIVKSCGG
jgi:hypothetical protein